MKKTKYLLFLLMLLTFFVSNTKEAEATKANPHPVYQDEWDYGVSGNHGHSYYYLMAPVRLGSASAVKNFYGVLKDNDASNYGWARSDATKSWYDSRLNAYYDWYWF